MVKKNPRAFQQYDVAFDKEGNLLEYYWDKPDPSKLQPLSSITFWEPNCIFADTLEFVSTHPTKGSAHFIFQSIKTGRKYSMFLSDFEDVLLAKRIIDGNKIQGEFTFCKKGNSQGMRMIIEEKE